MKVYWDNEDAIYGWLVEPSEPGSWMSLIQTVPTPCLSLPSCWLPEFLTSDLPQKFNSQRDTVGRGFLYNLFP